MITTLLFDLDGTLINTNELIIASFQHTLDQYYPQKYGRADIINFIGEPLETSFRKVDPERVDEMIQMYRTHNVAHHDELVLDYPNVMETIETLSKAGFRLGIVTTKRWDTVSMGLELMGLKPFFESVITIDDVERPKPDPQPVEMALKELGVEANEAVMIGDSPSDIEAGRRAGTKTVGVAWTIKGPEIIQAANPDYVIEDMKELLGILKTLKS